jgi:site-specific recombinase XerD
VQAADKGLRGATTGLHGMCGYAGGFVGPLGVGLVLDWAGSADGWGLTFPISDRGSASSIARASCSGASATRRRGPSWASSWRRTVLRWTRAATFMSARFPGPHGRKSIPESRTLPTCDLCRSSKRSGDPSHGPYGKSSPVGGSNHSAGEEGCGCDPRAGSQDERRQADLEEELAELTARNREPVTFTSILADWNLERGTDGSLKKYTGFMKQVFEFAATDDANRITAKQIVEFETSLRRAGKLHQNTIRNMLACYKAVFKFAKRKHMIETNPAEDLHVPESVETDVRDFPPALAKRIVSEAQKLRPELYLAVLIQSVTGCRVSEILNRLTTDIREEEGAVIFEVPKTGKGKGKTKSSARKIPDRGRATIPSGRRFLAARRKQLPRDYRVETSIRFARDSPLEGDGFEPSVPHTKQTFWLPRSVPAIRHPQRAHKPPRRHSVVGPAVGEIDRRCSLNSMSPCTQYTAPATRKLKTSVSSSQFLRTT